VTEGRVFYVLAVGCLLAMVFLYWQHRKEREEWGRVHGEQYVEMEAMGENMGQMGNRMPNTSHNDNQ
jgi:hypothetical protein